ncbi:TATA-binding protein-associated factor 172-like [Halichondria panicea]|uniref:TATA-binding protein-associated factor 172-like n=1 Tax=Halichondria panicea TaxID=6063 RepID=UPI00312BCBCF
MATRLERLWVLLDSGTSPLTRKAAAEQIGAVQKLHPHELHNLLKKVCSYLYSKSWETRVAAGQAVEAIAKNVKKWSPAKPEESCDGGETSPTPPDCEDWMTFDSFNIEQVLTHGTTLLSSTGEEFYTLDNDPEYLKMSPQERLSFHRTQLRQRLGLVAQGKVFSTGMEQLFEDTDLLPGTSGGRIETVPNRKNSGEVQELSALQLAGMSARERNRAKRKAKQMARRSSRDTDALDKSDMDPPTSKKPRTTSVLVEQAGQADKVLIDQVANMDSIFEESEEWPFTWFCVEMFRNLFNPAWEIRHGAATGLREIIKHHGDTAGISAHTSSDKRETENQQWLEDAAIRMVCVFALDRFADFVSDQVVAPVRATCAQALGMIVRQMRDSSVQRTVELLLQLVAQEQWEVRHASLMGVQHLLAARSDLCGPLLPSLSPCILRGLQDVDDDVRAVAAGSLLPVADKLHLVLPDKMSELVRILWDALLDLDDLSASTNSIMELLSTILSRDTPTSDNHAPLLELDSLPTLIPRLWPFLSHLITSVRTSSLRALLTILNYSRTSGDGVKGRVWLHGILDGMLSQLFQRLVLEKDKKARELAYQVWEAVVSGSAHQDLANALSPLIFPFLCLLVSPSSTPIDPAHLTRPSPGAQVPSNRYLGGCHGIESPTEKEQAAFMARVAGTKALGLLAAKLSSDGGSLLSAEPGEGLSPTLHQLIGSLQQLLSRNVATYKMVVSLVIAEWTGCPKEQFLSALNSSLSEQGGYEEITPFILALQKDCHSLIVAFDKKGVDAARDVTPSGYTAEFAAQLATTTFDSTLPSFNLTTAEAQEFESLRRCVLSSVGQLQEEHVRLATRVNSCLAGALVSLDSLPTKLNPVIRPFMDTIKTERDSTIQQLSGRWLSQLLDACKGRSPSPNNKIIKNLCSFICCDPQHTPVVSGNGGQSNKSGSSSPTEEVVVRWEWNVGIISLISQPDQGSSRQPQARGRPSAVVKEAMAAANSEEQRKPLLIQRHGAESALTSMAGHFASSLFASLPQLWSTITQPLEALVTLQQGNDDGTVLTDLLSSLVQQAVHSLQVLETLAPAIDPALSPRLLGLLSNPLLSCVTSEFTAVRHMAARCVAILSKVDLHVSLQFVIDQVLPFLGSSQSIIHREGAIETIAFILERVGLGVLCYVVLLLMPVLARMSDQEDSVRMMASRCFAMLVNLMPLESGTASPSEMPPSLVERRLQERVFLEQLLDTTKLDNYVVPVPIKADLRKYQQDGINWLAFLNKYNLHGILGDDMGLGKTLQSLCIIAGDDHYRAKQYKSTGHADSAPLPSLVVCPPTLMGHWYYEVTKFCDPADLRPLQYTGPPSTRSRLQSLVPKHNLLIASYDIVRNDIDYFRSVNWNYCVLDEGHIIKNTKTKITKAVKLLRANHRLILSGTPIQNNVLELWSLFDFLMPGFLGSERQFYTRYGRPIVLSREAKSSSKEQEAGVLAMEALHRQVLPFMLRRIKEDVLQDLPPKIIQDYQCDLSPLQAQLYEDFAHTRAKHDVDESITGEEKRSSSDQPPTHIFQALQYLRKVCNHPSLVVTPDHPLYNKVQDHLAQTSTTIRDIRHSAKLQALKQLLLDCGIGEDGDDEGAAVGQHRALLFCQYKSMLDIIEKDLLKVHLPSVTYLRLDGSVPAGNRHSIVQKFNDDPSIDVLLLTTHVGGLGLNLTGADTVIFFEHDWNPMKDLQAMDRAHRIGQKKVVNVYRLITRGTVEEKIMSLQKFKLNIANTVLTQENSSLTSMNTSDLLDLFQLSEPTEPKGNKESNKESGGMRSVMENLPELWSDDQYKNEYDLTSFVKSLASPTL